MTTYIPFTIEFVPVTTNLQVTPGKNCNALTFLNNGTAQVTIENLIVLQQGQSFTIEGNIGEIIAQASFNVIFGAGTMQLILIYKRY